VIPCLSCISDFDLSRMYCRRSPNSGHHYLAHGQEDYILSIYEPCRRYLKLKTDHEAGYRQRILTAETLLETAETKHAKV
jgi:hypothetical protein